MPLKSTLSTPILRPLNPLRSVVVAVILRLVIVLDLALLAVGIEIEDLGGHTITATASKMTATANSG